MLCVLFICVNLWEIKRTLVTRWDACNSLGRFFSHRTHRSNRTFLRTVSSPQNASGIQNSQNVTAKDGCMVLWNRLTWCLCGPLCVLFICVLCEKKNIFETRRGVLSLTELTDLTELFGAQFRTHRTPPAYRIHRTLLPKMAVRFCEIGWLDVSVKLCVFCSSVFFCEK